MTDYATVPDVEEAWRSLSTEEETRAAKLITYASARMRALVPGLDAALAAGTIEDVSAEAVCVSLVRRTMSAGDAGDGITQTTDAVGQVSMTRSYRNPMGTMYLTDDDYLTLGVRPAGNRARSMRVPFAERTTSGYQTCWPVS
jgi:hypothetical protein